MLVNQEEIKVAASIEKKTLITTGVSTCIAILAKGEANGIDYIALYHWEGFNASFNKNAEDALQLTQNHIHDVFIKIREEISCEFVMSPLDKPGLDALHIIGGQHGTENVSGTDLEIKALENYASEACAENFNVSDYMQITWECFTDETDSLTIRFSADDIDIIFDEHPSSFRLSTMSPYRLHRLNMI